MLRKNLTIALLLSAAELLGSTLASCADDKPVGLLPAVPPAMEKIPLPPRKPLHTNPPPKIQQIEFDLAVLNFAYMRATGKPLLPDDNRNSPSQMSFETVTYAALIKAVPNKKTYREIQQDIAGIYKGIIASQMDRHIDMLAKYCADWTYPMAAYSLSCAYYAKQADFKKEAQRLSQEQQQKYLFQNNLG